MIDDKLKNIKTKTDLIEFIDLLSQEYKNNGSKWENDTLERYLEAMSGWVQDMDGAYKNRNEEPPVEPTWRLFGEILLAATHYE